MSDEVTVGHLKDGDKVRVVDFEPDDNTAFEVELTYHESENNFEGTKVNGNKVFYTYHRTTPIEGGYIHWQGYVPPVGIDEDPGIV